MNVKKEAELKMQEEDDKIQMANVELRIKQINSAIRIASAEWNKRG